MKLYVCWGTFPTPAPRRAPLRERLPRAEGRRARAGGRSSPTGLRRCRRVFNQTRGRSEVEELTGKRWVPVLVLDDGTVIDDSHAIVEWAAANPA